MEFKIILILLLIIPFVYSEECDWEVEILSETIFQSQDDFEFRYFINRLEGERANVTLNRSIEDTYGNTVKSYELSIEENIVNYKTTSTLNPNMNPGTYLIKGEISPNCNDIDLENNLDEKLIVILPEILSENYTKLQITELFPDPIGNDDDPMPEGEWVEIYNSGSEPLDLEGLSLYDDVGAEPDIFITNTNTLDGTIILSNGYLTVYMNGRYGFLNNDNLEKIKLYKDDYLLDEVSYSGSKEGLSWSKVNDNWILTYPTPNEPNNIETPDHSSDLEIETAYLGSDEKAEFGDQIRVRLNIYKGDETKYNLDLYIKDSSYQVSKRTEINLYESFQEYTITAPIQIEPNCNEKYKDGTYTIYLKGFDEVATKEIEIEGLDKDLCKIVTEKVTTTSEKESSNDFYSTENQQIIDDNEITGEIIYQSSDMKAKNLGVYFFAGVLVIIIVFLLFKKNL